MPLKILIAEDSETNRLLFSLTLSRLGHAVTMAVNGHEAVSLFTRHPYDLVFLDLNMPVLGGVETAYEMQKINANCTPIYAISGFAAPELEDRFPEAGIVRCLIKPLVRENLAEVEAECGFDVDAPAPSSVPEGLPRRVIESYMRELWSRGQVCPRLLKSGDTDALLREAHTIAGLAHMLNTPALVEAAQKVEASARGDTAVFAMAVRALSAGCLKVSQYLKSHLNAATG